MRVNKQSKKIFLQLHKSRESNYIPKVIKFNTQKKRGTDTEKKNAKNNRRKTKEKYTTERE